MFKLATAALRLRYLIPATAVGSYYSVRNKIEDIKSQIPEPPDFITKLFDSGKKSLESVDLDSWTASLNESTQTFNEWLNEASAAMKKRGQPNEVGEYRYDEFAYYSSRIYTNY